MSADRSAASDGGPVVSRTRRPVGNRVPPSRSQPVFRHVRHSTGNPATAHHFTRPSARDVDRLSSSIQRGRVAIPRPAVWGRSAIALPLQPPGRFVTFRARRRPLCRPINGVATSAGNNIGDRPEIAPRPSHPHRRSNSDHAGKR